MINLSLPNYVRGCGDIEKIIENIMNKNGVDVILPPQESYAEDILKLYKDCKKDLVFHDFPKNVQASQGYIGSVLSFN